MSYEQQNSELTVFLVALAVILIVVLVIAVVLIVRRYRGGLTLKNSTYGNNIEGDRIVPTDHSRTENAGSGAVPNDAMTGVSEAPAHHHTGSAPADSGGAHHNH
jgi:hypothetical protein